MSTEVSTTKYIIPNTKHTSLAKNTYHKKENEKGNVSGNLVTYSQHIDTFISGTE